MMQSSKKKSFSAHTVQGVRTVRGVLLDGHVGRRAPVVEESLETPSPQACPSWGPFPEHYSICQGVVQPPLGCLQPREACLPKQLLLC